MDQLPLYIGIALGAFIGSLLADVVRSAWRSRGKPAEAQDITCEVEREP